MDKPLRVNVVTPDRTYFEGEASDVVVTAWDGELGILPGHAPLIARLGHGPIRVRPSEGAVPVVMAVFGGFVKVQDDSVIVLAAGVAEGKDLDKATVQKALAEAKERIEATRPPKAKEGTHEEALEAWRRARARAAASRTPH